MTYTAAVCWFYSKLNTSIISYQPTGRAIQVEGGYGERLPSIDTRPPRIRDSDAIIEVFEVCVTIVGSTFVPDSLVNAGAVGLMLYFGK